ncbi:MAG: zinc dependent phospholipase C family protein [Desulfitobacteriaceae bacterium]
MPKELTHWHIAKRTLTMEIPHQIAEIINHKPQLYYLGAIAHDIPFYDLSEPSETSIQHIGDQLHGANGENTLIPLIDMLEKTFAQKHTEFLLSFILGMLTHYVADSTFHPMIYYLSGNYYAEDSTVRSKAVYRHRLLETAIDLWLEAEEPMGYPVNLAKLSREAGRNGSEALTLLVSHYSFDSNKPIKQHFKSAWRNHRLLQAAFSWSIPWRILSTYRRFGHPGAEKHEALFYPQPLNLTFFQTKLDWIHPVTGENYTNTFGELYEASVQKLATIFCQLGSSQTQDWASILRNLEPLSLDSGMPYVPVSQMEFFFAEPIERKLRL